MWELHYDGNLFLSLPAEEADSFSNCAFYKLFLKRYVGEFTGNRICFKTALLYPDYKRIIALCQRETEKRGVPFFVSDTLSEYIQNREMHLEIRSRLGMEIKARDEKLSTQFLRFRTVVDDAMTRKLRERQMWDAFFMYAMKKSANFSVPGSGKTASVLGVYAYLHHTSEVNRILVICPKNAFGSWMDEFSACFGERESLRVLNIHASQYRTTAQNRSALLYDAGKCNLILVNYEAVGGVLDGLLALLDDKTLLVFDEVHKVKRIGGEHAGNALRIAEKACYVTAMTGTPIPNSYLDIYNLLHILFPDEYDEFFRFSPAMLRQPNMSETAEINDALQPFFCRTTKDQLGVPPVNSDILCTVPASDNENRLLKILKMKYRKDKLALLLRILQLESDAHMLTEALDLRDFRYLLDDTADTSEIDFADYSEEVRELIAGCSLSSKFNACLNTVQQLANEGKPVIVWCIFVHSIRRLAEKLSAHGLRCRCVYGEVELTERQEILQDFRRGRIQVLLTNPHTLAESVSLHSVCHDAVYFEYSYNLVHLLQSKDRIHRLGLPDGQYTQYRYMQLLYETEDGAWSMDRAVYDRLREKEQIMLNAIDRRLLEAMPTSEEDLAKIFEM